MRKLAVLLALLGFLAAPMAAQGWVNPYTGGVWNNPGSCLLDTMIRNRMNRQMLEKSIGRRTEAPPPTAAPRAERLTYRPSGALGNAEKLAASLTDEARDRQQLIGDFRNGLAQYQVAAARVGRANDLGYALAFSLACDYGAANGCDVADGLVLALAHQMDSALAEMPGLRAASDAERQTVAENLVMVGMFVAAGYEQSSARPEARAAFVELAVSGFRSLTGLDPRRVTLTDGGMRLR